MDPFPLTDSSVYKKVLLRCVMDSIPDLIFYKDKKGRILGCNKAYEACTGQSEKEQVGQTQIAFLTEETADSCRRKDQAVLTSGEPMRFEEQGGYPNGREVILDTMITPYSGPRKGVGSTCLISHRMRR